MYKIGQIIDYIDSTFDENLTNAIRWARENNAFVEEIIEKRKENTKEVIEEIEVEEKDEEGNLKTVKKTVKSPKVELHRFFEIKQNPEIVFETPNIETINQEDIKLTKRQERDFLMCEISDKIERYRNQKEINLKTTDSQETYIGYLKYMEYLRNIPNLPNFPNIEIEQFDKWFSSNK